MDGLSVSDSSVGRGKGTKDDDEKGRGAFSRASDWTNLILVGIHGSEINKGQSEPF